VPRWTPDPDRFPRFTLLDGPSPLARLGRLETALGGRAELWIKREDLLPLAFGGNKLRNLEFLVGAARTEGADTLVTVGRRWSNHARLTAAAGAKAGLEVHLVLSGPPTDPVNPGIRLAELFGATVHQARTADRGERAALLEHVVGQLRATGRRPAVIGVGGSGVTGAIGQVLAAQELAEQAAAAALVPDDLVVPSATGGTQAGLLVGLRTAALPTSVHGIAVTPADEVRAAVTAVVAELATVDGLASVDPVDIDIDAGQLGDGYGVPTEAADEATRLLARTEGILVDPIYTAKALAGLIERVRDGRFDGRRVVFWHAGGAPGLFEPLDGSAAGR
jgi:1-aminocyclopropane-1-carboxylate deaminase/D-cysteine desulfhydrase-like pyridoxal-dependent ACC family enzyme